jgi:hypothetical protein
MTNPPPDKPDKTEQQKAARKLLVNRDIASFSDDEINALVKDDVHLLCIYNAIPPGNRTVPKLKGELKALRNKELQKVKAKNVNPHDNADPKKDTDANPKENSPPPARSNVQNPPKSEETKKDSDPNPTATVTQPTLGVDLTKSPSREGENNRPPQASYADTVKSPHLDLNQPADPPDDTQTGGEDILDDADPIDQGGVEETKENEGQESEDPVISSGFTFIGRKNLVDNITSPPYYEESTWDGPSSAPNLGVTSNRNPHLNLRNSSRFAQGPPAETPLQSNFSRMINETRPDSSKESRMSETTGAHVTFTDLKQSELRISLDFEEKLKTHSKGIETRIGELMNVLKENQAAQAAAAVLDGVKSPPRITSPLPTFRGSPINMTSPNPRDAHINLTSPKPQASPIQFDFEQPAHKDGNFDGPQTEKRKDDRSYTSSSYERWKKYEPDDNLPSNGDDKDDKRGWKPPRQSAGAGGDGGDDDDDDGSGTSSRDHHGYRQHSSVPYRSKSRREQPQYRPTRPAENSPMNDPIRSDIYSLYLCGLHGITYLEELSTDRLAEIGFPAETHDAVLDRVDDIMTNWSKPDVNPKYLDSIHKLVDLSQEAVIDFYRHLEDDLTRYKIGITPFDAVLPRYKNVGICIPGVGNTRYMSMTKAFYSVLDKVLPKEDETVQNCISGLEGQNHDGFALMFELMAAVLPVFNPSLSSTPPIWQNIKNVAQMGKLWRQHWALTAKEGTTNSPVQKSNLFLTSITEPSLHSTITGLKGSIQQFTDALNEFDENKIVLPSNLTISGLIRTLTKSSSPITDSILFTSSKSHVSSTTFHSDRAIMALPDLQGAEMHATVSRPSPRNKPPRKNSKPSDSGTTITCRACLRRGHTEMECRQIGLLLCLTGWIDRLTGDQKKKVKAIYQRHWSTPPPRSVKHYHTRQLEEFCNSRNVSEQDVMDWYDWDTFCGSMADEESASETDASE